MGTDARPCLARHAAEHHLRCCRPRFAFGWRNDLPQFSQTDSTTSLHMFLYEFFSNGRTSKAIEDYPNCTKVQRFPHVERCDPRTQRPSLHRVLHSACKADSHLEIVCLFAAICSHNHALPMSPYHDQGDCCVPSYASRTCHRHRRCCSQPQCKLF